MSGIMCVMLGSGGLNVITPNNDYDSYGESAPASVSFYSDGTTSDIEGDSTPNWATPTTAGIGAFYWINVSTGTGTGTNTGSPRNTWVSMTPSTTFGINYLSGTIRSRTSSYSISSNSSGSPVVSSGTITLIADGTL